MDLDLALAAFQYFDGLGFHNFCLNRFGLDNIVFNFFATFTSVLGLRITVLHSLFSGPSRIHRDCILCVFKC